ncbi:MAG: hypothetical protein N2316_11210 [Spirochaetes bacterium]|nr:hypothetical protein [Spirochaetota bacterium]
MKKIVFPIIAVFCGFVGCSEADHFQLQDNGIMGIKGVYQYDDVRISFDVTSPNGESDEQSVVLLTVNDKNLEFEIDMSNESFLMDGYGAVLTDDEKDALKLLAGNIIQYLAQRGGELTVHEYAIVRILEYWAESPGNYAIGRREYGQPNFQNPIRLGISANEGITCIRKGTWVTAKYDDSKGDHSESVLVGSTARPGYECMGRCGAGCGSSLVPSSWCKDCLDHDQCSHKNYSSGGASDSNCGDEYNEAADDWMFGVARGCNGK